jgi:hypothetical protein
MGSLRLVIITLLTMLTGVAVAFGVASLIGLLWPSARVPIFLVLSIWWLWIGWRYASALDAARRSRVARVDALAAFYERYPKEIVADVELTDIPPRGYYLRDPLDCWFMLFSLHDERQGLRSRRLVAVSKRDGSIVYDGIANEEG